MTTLEGAICNECGFVFYPRRGVCPSCLSAAVGSQSLAGEGTIYSYSEVQLGVADAFRSSLPYTLALIDLREGPRLLAHVEPSPALEIGSRVKLTTIGLKGHPDGLLFKVVENA